TFYVLNRHINYSNICVNGCLFCAFSREAGAPGAFQLSLEDILGKLTEPEAAAITEVHIVGGCHPDLPLAYFETMLREIRRIRPHLVIKAFTAVEIQHFADREKTSVGAVLARLQAAGLELLPGGGAEVFSPRVRRLLCPNKLSGAGWLAVAREAHRMGIRSNATMLYGHLESHRERLEHLDALRCLQDETGGFLCFIPLPFQPDHTLIENARATTGVDDLKTIAVSRLMLDNIPHIKAYWVMLTVKVAQTALHFGADDLDGTVIEEKIGHMAGAESDQALTRSQLERLIRDAGFEPVERDSYFQPVARPDQTEAAPARHHPCP
ncbi:MAG: aminofutalosine synthase MqnE, partial [Syntrophobacteraceae bacterium CG07_land_8_20_14_0_80_61_8]